MADEVVSHAFSHGFDPQHTERLAAYWGEALGGPPAFSEAFGDETQVVRIHSGQGEHDDMDRRAIDCFDQALHDVGLGYLRLGQPATTLSGGEAQRIKIAAHLASMSGERVLYILDEPTTGLHFDDIAKLLAAFRKLVEAGHTLLAVVSGGADDGAALDQQRAHLVSPQASAMAA